GHAKSDNTQWIILGDLTTMYDFSGFWVTPMLREMKAKVNFVVMNNKGGQIFNRIFDSSLFLNSHDRHFQKMAEFWDWDFYDNPKEMKLSGLLNFIEINPSETETKKFWSDLDNK
ncbi:MAG: hypothetical protein HRT44_12040, partial [Bdellovibrionales bacterium]|nr:hypothetical protein [Bdellovibrionales bacterium]NQZ19969.1 hypothetical protein [Bdellovibrionales bacterium]